jgi:hypothetical protein
MKVIGHLRARAALTLGKESTVLTEEDAGWAPKSVWTMSKTEKSLALAGSRTPIPRPSSPQPVPCMLRIYISLNL